MQHLVSHAPRSPGHYAGAPVRGHNNETNLIFLSIVNDFLGRCTILNYRGDLFDAISSHGHSGIAKWVFGSIAHKIVQVSDKPVLVVRATRKKS